MNPDVLYHRVKLQSYMDDLICVTHILNWCNASFHLSVCHYGRIFIHHNRPHQHIQKASILQCEDMILHCGFFSFLTVARATSTSLSSSSVQSKTYSTATHTIILNIFLIILSLTQLFLQCCFLNREYDVAHPTPPVCCCLNSTGMTQLCSCCLSSAQPGSCPLPSLPCCTTSAAAPSMGKHKLTA